MSVCVQYCYFILRENFKWAASLKLCIVNYAALSNCNVATTQNTNVTKECQMAMIQKEKKKSLKLELVIETDWLELYTVVCNI